MPTAVEVLADADLRLEWAYQHIKRFESELQAFHARESYRLVRYDPQPNLLQVTDPPAIPAQLNLIASDAAHNIRVSLDYLACSLALLNGGPTERVYFPIADSVDEYGKPATQRKIQHISANAKAFIDGLKPYKGANDLLWALNEVNRTDKHRNLVFLGEGPPQWYFTPIPEKDETRDSVTQPQKYDYKITLVPAFADVDGFEHESALTLLKQFLGSVADILRDARTLFFPGTASRSVFGEDLPVG